MVWCQGRVDPQDMASRGGRVSFPLIDPKKQVGVVQIRFFVIYFVGLRAFQHFVPLGSWGR